MNIADILQQCLQSWGCQSVPKHTCRQHANDTGPLAGHRMLPRYKHCSITPKAFPRKLTVGPKMPQIKAWRAWRTTIHGALLTGRVYTVSKKTWVGFLVKEHWHECQNSGISARTLYWSHDQCDSLCLFAVLMLCAISVRPQWWIDFTEHNTNPESQL